MNNKVSGWDGTERRVSLHIPRVRPSVRKSRPVIGWRTLGRWAVAAVVMYAAMAAAAHWLKP